MRIGVTGARGFIGKNLLDYLTKRDHEIITTSRYVQRGSMSEFVKRCDHVVHLARKNKGSDEEILSTNVTGVLNIVTQCTQHSIGSLIISSDYSLKGTYRASNIIAGVIAATINKNMDGRNSVLALPKVFGPHCKPHYNSFVSTILYSIAKNEEYEHMIDDLNNTVGLIHVDRVCERIHDIVKEKSHVIYETMNSEMTHSFREIIAMAKGSNNVFAETVEWYRQNM